MIFLPKAQVKLWPNRDPIQERGGINLYGLVRNNPIGRVDYLGLAGLCETIEGMMAQPRDPAQFAALLALYQQLCGGPPPSTPLRNKPFDQHRGNPFDPSLNMGSLSPVVSCPALSTPVFPAPAPPSFDFPPPSPVFPSPPPNFWLWMGAGAAAGAAVVIVCTACPICCGIGVIAL